MGLDSGVTAGCSTFPLIWRIFGLSAAFEVIVIVLSCIPTLPAELKVTLMVPFSPFFKGCLGHSGTVQPHDPCASVMIKGSLPAFTNSKAYSTLSPCLIVPKEYSSFSNFIEGPSALATVEVAGADVV